MINNISTLFSETLNEMNISDKQKAVLQASLFLFSEKGFENTSTNDIATMADVAVGTVYKQFKNKEQLLKAVLEPIINEVIPKVANEFVEGIRKPTGLHFSDFLQVILQNRMQFMIDNLPQIRILIREAMVNKNIHQQMQVKLAELPFSKLQDIFNYYQTQGQLVDWDFIRILRYIAGISGSYLVPIIFNPRQEVDVVQMSREATNFLIKGLTP